MYDFRQSVAVNSGPDKDLSRQVPASDRNARLMALDDDPLDAWNERVAICTVDGGLSQEEAEAIAWREVGSREVQAQAAHVAPRGANVTVGEGKAEA